MVRVIVRLLRRMLLRRPYMEYDPGGLELRRLHDRHMLKVLRKR